MSIPKHPIQTEVHHRLRSAASCASQLATALNVTDGQRSFTSTELRTIKTNAQALQKLSAEMAADLAFMIASVDSLADEVA